MSSTRPDPVVEALPELPGVAEEQAEAERALPEAELRFEELAALTVDASPSLREQLRTLPTPQRLVLGVLVGLLVPALTLFALDFRGDLMPDGPEWMRVLAVVGCSGLLAVVTTVVALRGLHQRPLGWVGRGVVAVALLLPLALACLPGLLPGAPTGGELMPWRTGCLWAGLVSAGAAALVLRILDRSASRTQVLAAAGSGGLVGFGLLTLHCPMGHPFHLITAHGLLGLLVGVLLLGLGLVRKR